MSINELNRIYINDALKCKQLCEIVLPQSTNDNNNLFQIALIDNGRSIIIGGNYKIRSLSWIWFCSISVSDSDEFSSFRLYRVPLEHFPSLETFYPERIISSTDEIESTIETKPSKTISSQTKKGVVIAEIDKTSILFDEKIKELFRQRYTNKISFHFSSLFLSSTDNPMHPIDANVYVLVGMKSNFIIILFMNK